MDRTVGIRTTPFAAWLILKLTMLLDLHWTNGTQATVVLDPLLERHNDDMFAAFVAKGVTPIAEAGGDNDRLVTKAQLGLR
jgi:hypothetical protein